MINKYAGLTIKQIPTEQYVKNALSSTLKEIKKKASTLSLDPYNNDYAQNDIQSFKESVRSDIDGCVEIRKEEARLLRSKQQNELPRVNREVKQIEADIADYEKEEGRRAASKLNGALRPIPGWAIYLVLVFCICYDAFNVYSKMEYILLESTALLFMLVVGMAFFLDMPATILASFMLKPKKSRSDKLVIGFLCTALVIAMSAYIYLCFMAQPLVSESSSVISSSAQQSAEDALNRFQMVGPILSTIVLFAISMFDNHATKLEDARHKELKILEKKKEKSLIEKDELENALSIDMDQEIMSKKELAYSMVDAAAYGISVEADNMLMLKLKDPRAVSLLSEKKMVERCLLNMSLAVGM